MDLQGLDPVLDDLPDALVIADDAGVIRYANHTVHALLGYEPSELVGAPMDVLIPHRFRVAHGVHVGGYFAMPRVRPMAVGLSLVALRKDGSEVPVDISLAPIVRGGQRLAIAAIRDVSARRLLEERERQLEQARNEIRQRDEVLAIASHELRAPVGSMQLQVGLLRRLASAAADEVAAMRERMGSAAIDLTTIRQRVGQLEQHSRRLAKLIEQLLDSSYARHGTVPLKLEDADLAELARVAVDVTSDDVRRSGSELTLSADNSIRGRWDPIRIEQVIANLIANAAKFGRGRPIRVTVEGAAEQARVSVEDAGDGISPEDHERIFREFERARVSGGRLGLGLGLYLARQIVIAHGGRIEVRSALGSGATFTVELPRAPAVNSVDDASAAG